MSFLGELVSDPEFHLQRPPESSGPAPLSSASSSSEITAQIAESLGSIEAVQSHHDDSFSI